MKKGRKRKKDNERVQRMRKGSARDQWALRSWMGAVRGSKNAHGLNGEKRSPEAGKAGET